MKFNKRIKELRGTRTMHDFGKLIDTKVSTISAWENSGTLPSLPKLIDVAKSLHISSDYLLGLSDEKSYINYDTDINTIKYEDLLSDTYNLKKQPTGLVSYKLDKTQELTNSIQNNYPVDLRTIFNYTTEPTNTLFIAEARTGVELTYLTPLFKLLVKAETKPNIVSWFKTSEESIEFAKNNGYKSLHFTNFHKGFLKSSPFNLLVNMIDSPKSTIYSIMRLLFENAEDQELILLTNAYIGYRKEGSLQNMSFENFIDYTLKTTTISRVYGKELMNWATQPFIRYMDQDKDNYINSPVPLFIDFSTTCNENIIFNVILKLLQATWIEKSIPTHWVLENDVVDTTYLVIGLANNQTTTVMTTSKIAHELNYILLDNCDIIINYVPENGHVHNFLKSKETLRATPNKYSVYKHQYYQLPNIYTDNF